MTKAEEKRAAIVAQQEARELEQRQANGTETRRVRGGKVRTNWAATPPVSGPRRGRSPKP